VVVTEAVGDLVEPWPKEWRAGPQNIDLVVLPLCEKKNRSAGYNSERDRIGPSWVPQEGRGHLAKENSCRSCCNVPPTVILYDAVNFVRHFTTITTALGFVANTTNRSPSALDATGDAAVVAWTDGRGNLCRQEHCLV
jgi:hypothetical protein